MLSLKKIYRFFFFIILLCCFGIGGILQFFFGIPNTIYTFLILLFFYFFIIIYIVVKRKFFIDSLIIILCLFELVIISSGAINGVSLEKILIYSIFSLLPLGVYLFFKINQREGYITSTSIDDIFFKISLLQFPIMLIQHYGFPLFIKFNRSRQYIADFDFMFGSFFLKADHALGLFLLLVIMRILLKNDKRKITKYPLLVVVYLSFAILYGESNLSKLFLVIFLFYYLYQTFPKRWKLFGIILIALLVPIVSSKMKNIQAFKVHLYFMKYEYSVDKSYQNYTKGIAKRPQIVIVLANKFPLKYIGDGPYSYFDIIKGRFKLNRHFSQLIWTYVDIGIIGVSMLLLILIVLILRINVPSSYIWLIGLIVFSYAFLTTIFSDLGILIALFSFLKKRK
ncbi:hypothetical protein SAMN05216480_101130 [Pustulibacterium marinum]|uniref:O-Antigen ligase n=1 Tax=Pustulibacterium marinum TaxID=1224947 RepID=A0A1I7ETM9_9FLAO|nr:hypothetical protein [Pustulibacterium marinum]SFU27296.1 hypothetical protein SAMN05216480_101130 [Pustulibacterium marinum]